MVCASVWEAPAYAFWVRHDLFGKICSSLNQKSSRLHSLLRSDTLIQTLGKVMCVFSDQDRQMPAAGILELNFISWSLQL